MDYSEVIHIEIACKQGFNKKNAHSELYTEIHRYLENKRNIPKDHVFRTKYPNVESIMICTRITEQTPLNNLCTYKYILHDGPGEQETITQDGDEIEMSNHWLLPAREFHELWESLIYEEGMKDNLISFMQTTMLFSRRQVNANLNSCNRLLLLHGPPGTGKTSLCKALAQKLAIRMNDEFNHAHLFEINSHSLFSKWFSESGKLVQKVFNQIHELCQDSKALVCVLVDEVESIAFSRASISNNEPSDSIRVVNAVLTQLDRIRKYPNVFVLTTSNLTGSIDNAFLDRSDIVQYIGKPNISAIYEIYRTALEDLRATGIIIDAEPIPSLNDTKTTSIAGETLQTVSRLSVGFSGRTLRKVPFLAHALFVKQRETTLLKFLVAMRNAVRKMRADKLLFNPEGDKENALPEQVDFPPHESNPRPLQNGDADSL